ncbi:hypothetical protein QBC41DRAFT_329591 [Cercophora samala]|uniref:Cyclin-D1-binding protein 1-like N-terminal domain-containing protein n=1 Tax=Cercophora samala TaxID=330535 RepID=A0AA39Z1S3_9PEZI|nr:hypothetical protein QBC41DRAFT_329591 [Cercophora samala]
MPSPSEAVETLTTVVSNALTLIDQLEVVVSGLSSQDTSTAPFPTSQQSSATGPLDALSLAHDSATLIRAHATKISLLIINEPFTPTAITKVVRELIAGPLPGLAASAQECTAKRYTRVIQKDLAWRVARVLKELHELLSLIPKDGKILKDAKKSASAGAAGGKGSIAATGLLWAACDDLMAFCKRGFGGNLVYKVDQLRETLKDVMEELKEWSEETGDDEDEDEDDDDEGEDGVAQVTNDLGSTSLSANASTQAMLDDLMNSQSYIPRDDPDKIRERLESCLRRLRLTSLLYQAAAKRRLKPLPHTPPTSDSNVPARLDEVLALLKGIPDRFGNLAMAFYELDPVEIDRLMDQCFFDAFAASELLVKPWDGQKDEFTDWALKFQVEIKKSMNAGVRLYLYFAKPTHLVGKI